MDQRVPRAEVLPVHQSPLYRNAPFSLRTRVFHDHFFTFSLTLTSSCITIIHGTMTHDQILYHLNDVKKGR